MYDKYYYGIESVSSDLDKARKLMKEVADLAEKYNLPVFCVTEGASVTRNNGNEAIRRCRETLVNYEKEVGSDPNEDWNKNK